MNMNANTDSNRLVEDTNKLVSDGGSSGASWVALRFLLPTLLPEI